MGLLAYTSGLTWKTPEVERLLNQECRGRHILRALDCQSHERLAQFGHARHFVDQMLPILFREAQRITRLSGDRLTLLLFGAFCVVYSFVWLKCRIRANKEDLRSLVGAEMLILRRAEI